MTQIETVVLEPRSGYPTSRRIAELSEELRKELLREYGSDFAFSVLGRGNVLAGSSAGTGAVIGNYTPRKVDVVYKVALFVTLDTVTGEVEAVHVDDGSADFWYIAADGAENLTDDEVTRLRDLADDTDWPAWRVG